MDIGKQVVEGILSKNSLSKLKSKISEYTSEKENLSRRPYSAHPYKNEPIKPTVSMISQNENLLDFLENHYQANKKTDQSVSRSIDDFKNRKKEVSTTFATYDPNTEFTEIEQRISQIKNMLSERIQKELKKTDQIKQKISTTNKRNTVGKPKNILQRSSSAKVSERNKKQLNLAKKDEISKLLKPIQKPKLSVCIAKITINNKQKQNSISHNKSMSSRPNENKTLLKSYKANAKKVKSKVKIKGAVKKAIAIYSSNTIIANNFAKLNKKKDKL